MLLLIVCQLIILLEDIFKDLMQAITLTVTNDKEKIFFHLTSQLAIEDVSDFRNMHRPILNFLRLNPLLLKIYLVLDP